MAEFYNIVDCTINIANNEGFGLTTAESVMAGTPIITNVTGGLQDQLGFDFTPEDYVEIKSLHDPKISKHLVQEGEWAFPVWSSAININGSPLTPYIFDDRINNDDVAEQIYNVYSLGRKERKERGLKGREWALSDEAGFTGEKMGQKIIGILDNLFLTWKPREKFELLNTKNIEKRVLNHKLRY